MIIDLGEGFRIVVDEYNHKLERYDEGGKLINVGKARGKMSEPRWVMVGYYPNVQQALNRVIKLCVTEQTKQPVGLKEYIQQLNEFDKKYKVFIPS